MNGFTARRGRGAAGAEARGAWGAVVRGASGAAGGACGTTGGIDTEGRGA
ncbi:MAG: hypothetical protein AB7I33_09280 [Gemmatimonadales bacterium]